MSGGSAGPAVSTTQPLLPTGEFRDLMRAGEHVALHNQRHRAASLDHLACSELAQAEASLLIEMEASIARAITEGGSPSGARARELLRNPLDGLASSLRGAIASYFDDEAASIKRALAGLASDCGAVHEREGRRAGRRSARCFDAPGA